MESVVGPRANEFQGRGPRNFTLSYLGGKGTVLLFWDLSLSLPVLEIIVFIFIVVYTFINL